MRWFCAHERRDRNPFLLHFLIAWSALVFLETMKNRDAVAKQWIAKANLMSNI